MFNSPQEIGDAAINAGFDIFNCANNHIMDKGSQGIMNEIEYFKSIRMLFISVLTKMKRVITL